MEKAMIIDAYIRGLLSKEECEKILGIDPNILIRDNINMELLYGREQK